MDIRHRLRRYRRLAPGVLLALVIATAATYVGHLAPVVGAPIVAIIIGILFSLALGDIPRAKQGVAFTSRRVLQFAIILLGANLNLAVVWKTGEQSFWVMIGSLAVALAGGTLIGKFFRLPRNMVRLITVGTSICGASAISAVAPIIEAEDGEIAYAISTIFLFNVIAVFLFPLIGHMFHFTAAKFGMWAGTAINDTSSVVAAGYSFSNSAGAYATIVKLTRSLAIIPVSLFFAIHSMWQEKRQLNARNDDEDTAHIGSMEHRPKRKLKFPMFILGFVLMSTIATLHVFGHSTGVVISEFGQFFVSVALAAIGLNTNLRALFKTGPKPLLMGLCTWALVAVSSLVLQYFTT